MIKKIVLILLLVGLTQHLNACQYESSPYEKVFRSHLKKVAHHALCMSIKIDYIESVNHLLRTTPIDINSYNWSGHTPLTLACRLAKPTVSEPHPSLNDEMVSVLLEAKADPCQKDLSGKTAIDFAIEAGDNNVLKLLLAALAQRSEEKEALRRSMAAALKRKDALMVNTIVAHGYNPHARGYKGMTALMIAASNNDARSIRKLMVDHLVNPNAQNDAGQTALMIAAQKGYCNALCALIESSREVTASGVTGLAIRGSIRDKQGRTVYDVPQPYYIKDWLKKYARR